MALENTVSTIKSWGSELRKMKNGKPSIGSTQKSINRKQRALNKHK